jgi:cytochrome c biogenesis protein ResB
VAEPLPSGDDSAAALEAVSQRLAGLGVRGSVGGDTFVSASSRWTVWGSPVFHWALVVVFLTVSLGSLFRAEGLMGVPEGASVPDEAASYRVLTAGPLHQWPGANRTISVVSLDPDYKAGGIARGPAPQVSVSNASGAVLRRQVVYPNNALHIGSLTIHTGGFGLSTRYKLTDSTGAALGTSSAILDFPTGADRKTVPGDVALTGSDGQTALIVRSTVALDTSGTDVVFAVPKHPVTDVELLDGSGKQLSAKSLAVGESMNLPDGSTLQLQNVGYYARLSVVEDPTIPVLYAALAAALVGVAVALLSRQRLVAVVARGTEEAVELAVTARLWRNAGVSPQDLREAIAGISTDDEQESHD